MGVPNYILLIIFQNKTSQVKKFLIIIHKMQYIYLLINKDIAIFYGKIAHLSIL